MERRHAPRRRRWGRAVILALLALGVCGGGAQAQAPVLDRLPALPRFDRVVRMQDALREAPPFESGEVVAAWADDSRSFTYSLRGRRYRFDLATMTSVETGAAASEPGAESGASEAAGPCPRVFVERGRQSACASSPDRTLKAFHRDQNLYLSRADGSNEVAISTDGSAESRIKYGVASWVYGEELDQTTAIWWAPDGRKVAFYRFDERAVRDYYVTIGQTSLQDAVDVEAFPKAGTDNPIADVLVYDLASRTTVKLDVRDGKAFADDVLGYYVYAIGWAPDSSEVRMYRTTRRQQEMEFSGCSPLTATCRRIVHEAWPTGWIENRPAFRALADGRRFLWSSNRTGWRNYELRDFAGSLVRPLTAHPFDAASIVRVDEANGALFYMARDGDNAMKLQLHRAPFQGGTDRRLTDPRFTHDVRLSPDGRFFVDVFQAHDQPPVTQLVNVSTGEATPVATSNLSRMLALGLRPVEYFSYLAADGRTMLTGSIEVPSDFDPARRYPVLISVYGGPEDDGDVPDERFVVASPMTEYGLLRVELSTRAMPGLGRRVLDSLYRKLGQTEVEDLAAGVRALGTRPYVDAARVGIYGTSYGGYAAAMALLRYPDLFAAASAASPVSDWRLYDTIYTERYMRLPAENADGYDRGSLLQFAPRLRGRLLLYYGTADNNVHPSNSLQLIQAFSRAGKSIEVQVGPDAGHSAVPMGRMMEFFVENLIVNPGRLRVN